FLYSAFLTPKAKPGKNPSDFEPTFAARTQIAAARMEATLSPLGKKDDRDDRDSKDRHRSGQPFLSLSSLVSLPSFAERRFAHRRRTASDIISIMALTVATWNVNGIRA